MPIRWTPSVSVGWSDLASHCSSSSGLQPVHSRLHRSVCKPRRSTAACTRCWLTLLWYTREVAPAARLSTDLIWDGVYRGECFGEQLPVQ